MSELRLTVSAAESAPRLIRSAVVFEPQMILSTVVSELRLTVSTAESEPRLVHKAVVFEQ